MIKWEKEHAAIVVLNMVKLYVKYKQEREKEIMISYSGKLEGYIQGVTFADKDYALYLHRLANWYTKRLLRRN